MSGPSQDKRRGRPKKIDADQVREVAMRTYCQQDLSDVSINAICELAGVSKPSLYREFGSEDGLMLSVLEKYQNEVLSEVANLLSKSVTMSETFSALVDFIVEDERMKYGCLYHKMLARKHQLGPKTSERVAEIEESINLGFTIFLQSNSQSSGENGAFGAQVSVEDGANYLAAQFALAVTQRAAGKPPAHIKKTLMIALSVFQ